MSGALITSGASNLASLLQLQAFQPGIASQLAAPGQGYGALDPQLMLKLASKAPQRQWQPSLAPLLASARAFTNAQSSGQSLAQSMPPSLPATQNTLMRPLEQPVVSGAQAPVSISSQPWPALQETGQLQSMGPAGGQTQGSTQVRAQMGAAPQVNPSLPPGLSSMLSRRAPPAQHFHQRQAVLPVQKSDARPAQAVAFSAPQGLLASKAQQAVRSADNSALAGLATAQPTAHGTVSKPPELAEPAQGPVTGARASSEVVQPPVQPSSAFSQETVEPSAQAKRISRFQAEDPAPKISTLGQQTLPQHFPNTDEGRTFGQESRLKANGSNSQLEEEAAQAPTIQRRPSSEGPLRKSGRSHLPRKEYSLL